MTLIHLFTGNRQEVCIAVDEGRAVVGGRGGDERIHRRQSLGDSLSQANSPKRYSLINWCNQGQ